MAFSRSSSETLSRKHAKRPGSTGVNLLLMLERRFDNVVYRMGFAATRREARQLVSHGHFYVNGKKANIPSMELREGDVITVKTRARILLSSSSSETWSSLTPKWVTIDTTSLKERSLHYLQEKISMFQSLNISSSNYTPSNKPMIELVRRNVIFRGLYKEVFE